MAVQDPPIIFVGVWYNPFNRVSNEDDFGVFYIWDVQDGTYWGFDRLGVSNIKIDELENNRIMFKKEYINPQRSAFREEIEYSGRRAVGETYKGEWSVSNAEGKFILTRPGRGLSDIVETLGALQMHLFEEHIKEKRKKLKYLPLKDALQE